MLLWQIFHFLGDAINWLKESPISTAIYVFNDIFDRFPAPLAALGTVIVSILAIRILMKLL